MKKYGKVTILTTMILTFGCIGAAHAEVIPAYSPGQQIGYPAVVLCEELSVRENPSSSSAVIQTLNYKELPIVVDADLPTGPREENGFVYCTLGDSEDAPSGWINQDYIFINPAWYVTEKETPAYAWNDTAAPKIALLESDTRFPILKEEGDWYLVSMRGAVGWIHK